MLMDNLFFFSVLTIVGLLTLASQIIEKQKRTRTIKRAAKRLESRHDFMKRQLEHNARVLAIQTQQKYDIEAKVIFQVPLISNQTENIPSVRDIEQPELNSPSVSVSLDTWIENNRTIDELRNRLKQRQIS